MINEELTMSNEEARKVLSKLNISVAADATPILSKNQVLEATSMAIEALEQIELNSSYNGVKTELESCEDCIRELIREFDNKHPAIFAYYMETFNLHPISEIIDYMWDMYNLIEDIRYRLPMEVEE